MCSKEKMIFKLWFCNIDNIGIKTRKKLIEYFGSVENIYEASSDLLAKVLNKKQLDNLLKSKNLDYIVEYKKRLDSRNIKIIYPESKDYPIKLKNIYLPPDILYLSGELPDNINDYNSNIAIVGGREADVYSREVARYFGKELSNMGINIISGLARGIDSQSHIGALANKRKTLGVLGCGINVTYPAENVELFEKMKNDGGIISEYGLNVKPLPGQFPVRNRIISGLSDGVLVVQAKEKSGSLITTDMALEQGKQIYSIPGRILESASIGNNNLIKSGAMCVTTPLDVYADIKGIDIKCLCENTTNAQEKSMCAQKNESYTGKNKEKSKEKNKEKNEEKNEEKHEEKNKELTSLEEKIYVSLSLEPKYIDKIINEVHISVTQAINVLFTLEQKGLIKQPVKGYYIINI